METKHTPGPWVFQPGHDEIIAPMVVVLGDDGACGDPDCCGPATYTVEIKPEDGQLIAAAHRMLYALQQFAEAFDDLFSQCASNGMKNAWGKEVDCTKLNHASRVASDAIASATGA